MKAKAGAAPGTDFSLSVDFAATPPPARYPNWSDRADGVSADDPTQLLFIADADLDADLIANAYIDGDLDANRNSYIDADLDGRTPTATSTSTPTSTPITKCIIVRIEVDPPKAGEAEIFDPVLPNCETDKYISGTPIGISPRRHGE